MYTNGDLRHMKTKIRLSEDTLLREKNNQRQVELLDQLTWMRNKLQKMRRSLK